jgi:GGDEF domain-containing protein
MNSKKPNIPAVERRVDLDQRRRVAEMSLEETRRLLLTSEVTGLPSRRAFDEAGIAPAVAMSDLDGLKTVNDQYSYEAGNALLKAKGDALRQVGLDAYHDKGDEFLYRGSSVEELRVKLEAATGVLANCAVIVRRATGDSLSLTGAKFSFGVGKSLEEAEAMLKAHKDERQRRGELGRGRFFGITAREEGLHQAEDGDTPKDGLGR